MSMLLTLQLPLGHGYDDPEWGARPSPAEWVKSVEPTLGPWLLAPDPTGDGSLLGGVGIPPALWQTYHSLKFVPAFVARLDAVIEPPPLPAPAPAPPGIPPLPPPPTAWLLCSDEPAGEGSLLLSLASSKGGGGDLLWTFMCLRKELGCV